MDDEQMEVVEHFKYYLGSLKSPDANSIIYSHNTVQLYSMHVSVTKYNVDPSIPQ